MRRALSRALATVINSNTHPKSTYGSSIMRRTPGKVLESRKLRSLKKGGLKQAKNKVL